jgi:hypothetical protein
MRIEIEFKHFDTEEVVAKWDIPDSVMPDIGEILFIKGKLYRLIGGGLPGTGWVEPYGKQN